MTYQVFYQSQTCHFLFLSGKNVVHAVMSCSLTASCGKLILNLLTSAV